MGNFRSVVLHICCTIHVWSNTANTGHIGANLERVFLLTYCFNSCVVCGYNCFIYYLLDIEKIIIIY